MNSTVQKFFTRCAWTVIFVCTLSFLYGMYSVVERQIATQKLVILDRGNGVVSSIGKINTTDVNQVTYAELIGTLMDKVEYDIEVDGYFINHKDHKPYLFDFSSIRTNDLFQKDYVVDNNGNIKRIIYRSIN